jgi:hypothetical protein
MLLNFAVVKFHRASNGERLAALMRVETVDPPSAQQRVHCPVGVRHQRASMTERQIIGACDVNDVRGIAVAERVVRFDSEIGKPLGPILLIFRRLGVLVVHALAPGVVAQQIKIGTELMLIRYLQLGIHFSRQPVLRSGGLGL